VATILIKVARVAKESIYMTVEVKTRLRQIREGLSNPKVSQEAIARQAGLSLQWYRQLENGLAPNTSWTSANAILQAFNAERQRRNQGTVALDQLELNIV
jgi:DNA-binding XRE family transcriptional regulator